MYIYCIENITTGKKYVGRCKRTPQESENYYGSGKIIKQAIKKETIQNFKKTILEDQIPHHLIEEREIYWIKTLNTKSPVGYNLTDGGGGLINPTLEIRQKISEKLKGEKNPRFGIPISEETRQKLSQVRKGCRRSKEQVEKHKQAMTGKKATEETKLKMSIAKQGKKQSEEHVEKRRQALQGRTLPEEHKRKISAGNKGKVTAEETRSKIRESNRKTVQVKQIEYTTGELVNIFSSINEASRKTGIDLSGISCAANGKYKQYRGFIWEKIKKDGSSV